MVRINGNLNVIPEDFDSTLQTISVGTDVSQVKTAIEEETKIFNNILQDAPVEDANKFKSLAAAKEKLVTAAEKYETAVNAASDCVNTLKNDTKGVISWIWSNFRDSAALRQAKANLNHLKGHQEKLSQLRDLSAKKEERIARCKAQLQNAQLTVAETENKAIASLKLNQLQQSTVSLLKNTQFVIDGQEFCGDLKSLLFALNEVIGVEEENAVTAANAEILSCTDVPTNDIAMTSALNVLKFCSKEAYQGLRDTLYDNTFEGIVPYSGKDFTKISVQKEDDTIRITSEASFQLATRLTSKPFATVDAVMTTAIDANGKAKTGFVFQNVNIHPRVTLAQVILLERAFPEKKKSVVTEVTSA